MCASKQITNRRKQNTQKLMIILTKLANNDGCKCEKINIRIIIIHKNFFISGKHEITEDRISQYQLRMILEITGFSSEDSGTYTCVSTNTMGKAEGTLRLYGKIVFKYYSFNHNYLINYFLFLL